MITALLIIALVINIFTTFFILGMISMLGKQAKEIERLHTEIRAASGIRDFLRESRARDRDV
jgi:hypothetical protein